MTKSTRDKIRDKIRDNMMWDVMAIRDKIRAYCNSDQAFYNELLIFDDLASSAIHQIYSCIEAERPIEMHFIRDNLSPCEQEIIKYFDYLIKVCKDDYNCLESLIHHYYTFELQYGIRELIHYYEEHGDFNIIQINIKNS